MTPTRLNTLLASALIAGGLSQGGCILIPPFGGSCWDDSGSGLVDESVIEWEDKLTPYGVQTIANCDEVCAENHVLYYGYVKSCYGTGAPSDGQIMVKCEWEYCSIGGRRTEGLNRLKEPIPRAALSLTPRAMAPTRARVAEELRRYAFMEASAVYAFGQLKAELRAHRAPRRLIRKAARAQVEERRHAKVMAAHAKRWGATLETPRYTAPPKLRSLKEIALENAIEGCVHETWGALIAQHQAETSTDLKFKRTAGPISEDETRHAAFSWELHRYLMGRLSKAERLEIKRAQFKARSALFSTIEGDLEAQPLGPLGLPGRERGLKMWRALERTLPFNA